MFELSSSYHLSNRLRNLWWKGSPTLPILWHLQAGYLRYYFRYPNVPRKSLFLLGFYASLAYPYILLI